MEEKVLDSLGKELKEPIGQNATFVVHRATIR